MKISRVLFLGILLAVLAGCATPTKMGVTKDTQKLDLSEKSLYLMSVELRNDYRPS